MSINPLSRLTGASNVVITPNCAQRARRVPRRISRSVKRSRNIAAIDFGTKNCSLAYITEHDASNLIKTGIPKLPLNGTFLRVPTAILVNPEGHVLAFGHDARTLYGNLRDSECEAYLYFEEIKMNLHQESACVSACVRLRATDDIAVSFYMHYVCSCKHCSF